MVAAAFPASAPAADFAGEVSADSLQYAWAGVGTGVPISAVGNVSEDEGGPNPFGCGTPGHDCDYVKLNVVHPGDLNLTLDFSDGGESVEGIVSFPDIDGALYKADKDGNKTGDSLTGTDCGTGVTVEKCSAKGLQPGLYVVEVSFFLADEATYKGTADLVTSVPPTPPAAPAAPEAPAEPAPQPGSEPAPASYQPPPPAQPYVAEEPKKPATTKKKKSKKAKRAACNKKAKKIKNKGKRKKALKRCARRYR